MNGWRFPDNLQPIADQIQPQETAFFHGALEEEKLGFAEKLIVKGLKAPLGDYRDWERISGWAAEIADRLRKNGQV
jgi:menaquinone-dependent protoporphyrinogen oxidase